MVQNFERLCAEFISSVKITDSVHDFSHVQRVVTNAKAILMEETADHEIVIAATWLHDCVVLPKNDPDRKKASLLAAQKATDFLSELSFPKHKLPAVAHAIESHSYSADITPTTTEAKIVQDADRLDALGAIGLARCFTVGGITGRLLYSTEDPFCETRIPDDSQFTLDHFFTKLFKLPELMHTQSAKKEAVSRIDFMKDFLQKLGMEIPK
ncbi:MAG: HD domain-containing protein [Balneolaceae bacterium]